MTRRHVATRRHSYAPRQVDVQHRDAREVLLEAMTEEELLKRVTDDLTLAGMLWTHHRRSDLGQLMGHPGCPDITAVGAGRFLMLELKTEHGRVDDLQEAWIRKLLEHDVDARVLRPHDLVAFERELGLL